MTGFCGQKTKPMIFLLDWNGLHSCNHSVVRVTTATTAGSRDCTQCTLAPHQGYDTASHFQSPFSLDKTILQMAENFECLEIFSRKKDFPKKLSNKMLPILYLACISYKYLGSSMNVVKSILKVTSGVTVLLKILL
jgi:hypothetical protein